MGHQQGHNGKRAAADPIAQARVHWGGLFSVYFASIPVLVHAAMCMRPALPRKRASIGQSVEMVRGAKLINQGGNLARSTQGGVRTNYAAHYQNQKQHSQP